MSPRLAGYVGVGLEEKPLLRECKLHAQQPREGAKLFWSQLRPFPKAAPSPSLGSGTLHRRKGGARQTWEGTV